MANIHSTPSLGPLRGVRILDLATVVAAPLAGTLCADMGAEVMGGTSAEFAKFTAAEVKRYEAIVKNSGAPKE